MIFDSILVQNKTPDIGFTQSFIERSCVKFYNLQTQSASGFFSFQSIYNEVKDCPHYITNESHASLTPRNFCPLNGTLNKATLFLKKSEFKEFSDTVAVINGCNYVNEYGRKFETFWILSNGSKDGIKLKLDFFLTNHMYWYDQIVADDIYFDGFNRDCSKLCELHSTQIIYETLIFIDICVHRELIVCAIIICILSTLVVF